MVFENIRLKPELREKKATAFRFLILFLKIGIFFFLWQFSPPTSLAAQTNFLNTVIPCSGNGTAVFFQLDFFPSSARNASPLSAAPSPRTLSARLPRDRPYTTSKAKLLTGVLQLPPLALVDLRTLPLNTANLKRSSVRPRWHVQQDKPSRYRISRVGSRLTSPLTKIFPFLPSPFPLPKEQCSKLPGCSAFPLSTD